MLLWVACLTSAALRVDTYARCAPSGNPTATVLVPSGNISLSDFGCFAEVTGVLHATPGFYTFACELKGGQNVFVWVDDHLICHSKSLFGEQGPSAVDGSVANPLEVRPKPMAGRSFAPNWSLGPDGNQTVALPFVAHIYAASANSTGQITSARESSVCISWAQLLEPLRATAAVATSPLPAGRLSSETPALEQRRRELQRRAASGWGAWTNNMLSIVRLPHSVALTTSVCLLSTGRCLRSTRVEDTASTVRVGPYAVDGSYWHFYLGFAGANLSISVAGGNQPLRVLLEPLGCAATRSLGKAAGAGEGASARSGGAVWGCNCSDLLVVASLRYMWQRAGTASAGANGSLYFHPAGFPEPITVLPTRPPASVRMPPGFMRQPHAAWTLGEGPLGLAEMPAGHAAPTLEEVQEQVAAAAAAEAAVTASFGQASEIKEAVQAAVMWNAIYTPSEYGPVLPVSRAWDFVRGTHEPEWGYVLFGWDNLFASYLLSADPRPAARDLAYSNLIQVVRSRTSRGFVPNYSAGGSKSADRTEPPVGARVLREIYSRYGEAWLVQLLYGDLRGWSDWCLGARGGGAGGVLSLGSDTIDGYADDAAGSMQGARYESGLDNSPMYDGDFFNRSVLRRGSQSTGLMQLSDVGFASLFVQDATALAELASGLGWPGEAVEMRERAEDQRRRIALRMWDAESACFVNRFYNGTFYRRISPTSFYALGARAATDEQAMQLITGWMLNRNRFCIAPAGDFVGNSDECYWGLPSIAASDPAFPPLGYWRGYVWGPMALLVYWSLLEYDHLPVVRATRKALCRQMTSLMISHWRAHRHICENFSPHRNATDCSGTKFYHWGALMGLITMVEDGRYTPLPLLAPLREFL